jgi:hypothetical protein
MAEGPSPLPQIHHELASTTDAAWALPDAIRPHGVASPEAARRERQAVTPQLLLAGLVDELPAPQRVQPFIEDELLPLTLVPVEPAAFEPSATTATTTITPKQRRRAEEPARRR